MSQSAVDHYIDQFAALQLDNAQTWLNEHRKSAIEAFSQSGFPGLHEEDWKYTDIRPITKRNFVIAGPNGNGIEQKQIDSIRYRELDCHELVFINGNYSASLSTLHALPQGAILQSLAAALIDNRELLEAHLNQPFNQDNNAFIALNTAFMADGAFIYVPDETRIEKPINLLFLTNTQAKPLASNLRNLIVLGKNAQATIIENYIGFDNAEYFINTLTNIVTGSGSQLDHYKVQQESQRGYHIGNTHGDLHRDSRLESHSISLGGAIVRNAIDINLAEHGAEVVLNGLYMASGRQHVDNHTYIHHKKPHTTSVEDYRGVLSDHARGVFNGKVTVHEQAQKSDAQQSNANLLLSDNAEVDTKPELEIYANDVKCSHGASIGQLDETMLFYLRSRAIDEETAKSQIIFAFADGVVNRIKFAPIRERLESIIVGKLPDAELIRNFRQ